MMEMCLYNEYAIQVYLESLRNTGTHDLSFINLKTLDPDFIIDLRYSTENNFARKKFYDRSVCYLRAEVAKRLVRVHERLKKMGYRLKIFDAFRPFSFQEKLWAECSDENYMARPVRLEGQPFKGSNHNRGAAVDLTLTIVDGVELEMPSGFDEFSEKAHRTYSHCSEQARKNAELLEREMNAEGFLGAPTEWWHFDALECKAYEICDEWPD